MLTLPRNDLKKQPVLQQVAKRFEKGKMYEESEVNEIIKSCDVDDHVLFRRELICFGYLGRDPHKGAYWSIKSELSKEELAKITSNWKSMHKCEDIDEKAINKV